MTFVLMDLEWNGSYSKAAHGYFNEIIEIGATKLDDQCRRIGSFHALIRPVVSRKLTNIVTNLTGIEAEELQEGDTFEGAVRALQAFMGEDAILLTWSTTDLLVLLENCRFFLKKETIPFMELYADAQAYCQARMSNDKRGRQISLTAACQLLGISEEGLEAHRAQDDSELTARVFARLFEPDSFEVFIRPADKAFYEQLTFKTHIVSHVSNPLVKPEYLEFTCPACGRPLKPSERWRFNSRMLCAEMPCECGRTYLGRVQIKVQYNGVNVRRRLVDKSAKAEEETSPDGGNDAPKA